MAAKFDDAFVAYFGEVVADLRAKLIDEGWFQRRSAEPDVGSSFNLQQDRAQGLQAEWTSAFDPDPDSQNESRDVHGHDHEHGIDR